MGRPRKCRQVSLQPEVTIFKPQGVPMSRLQGVVLAIDGLEALHLVDAEGLSQEEAAQQMGVSRPTLCRILGEARMQVARALSRGWAIRIALDEDAENDAACISDMCVRPGQGCSDENMHEKVMHEAQSSHTDGASD